MQYAVMFLLATTVVSLAACTKANISPAQEVAWKKTAAQPITCQEGSDCEEKWNRAIAWVNYFSEEGIRTVTPNLIRTNATVFGVLKKDQYKVTEYTIVRYKRDPHTYVIDFHSACERFSCGLPGYAYRAHFTNYLLNKIPLKNK